MTNGPHPSPRGANNPDFGDAELNARVVAGLAAVEELLSERLSEGEELISEKVRHVAFAGGKRERAAIGRLSS